MVHRLEMKLGRSCRVSCSVSIGHGEELTDLLIAALGIVGTYCGIEARGRLGFFGAHAVSEGDVSCSAVLCIDYKSHSKTPNLSNLVMTLCS